MQIVRYVEAGKKKIGFLVDTKIYECSMVIPGLPATEEELRSRWKRCSKLAELAFCSVTNNKIQYPLFPVKVTDVEEPEIIDLSTL